MAIVPSPPALPPPHSLVRAADTTHDGDPNWQKGLQYLPEAPGGYRAAAFCTTDEVDHARDLPVAVDYEPFEVRFLDPCETTFGYREQEVTDRLRRVADATESYAIARELWTGELAKAASNPNGYLGKAPTVLAGGAPQSPRRALGLLEEAVGDALMGQQAFIHASRATLPSLDLHLTKVGNLLFTKIDNAFVADAGYVGGHAPDGETDATDVAWLYATGPVVVRRSELTFYAAADAEVIDTTNNTRVRTASKLVAATFDPAVLFAVPVTLS